MSKSVFNAYFGRGAPRREQNLFVGYSKHWYVQKDGILRWQRKELDPRTAGGRRLLGRMVLLDVDTGWIYGEYHDRDRLNTELAAFLARAWSVKPDHAMRGVPSLLNVGKAVLEEHRNPLGCVSDITGVQIGNLPSGFASGVHAVKAIEGALLSLCTHDLQIDLFMAQEASAVLSAQASSGGFMWKEAWLREEGLSEPQAAQFDDLYEPAAAWRAAPFDLVLEGIPKRADQTRVARQ